MMKLNRKAYKALPVLLCCVMLLGMLLAGGYGEAAAAARSADIKTVLVKDISTPLPGNVPDYQFSCGDKSYSLSNYFDADDVYCKNGVQWVDITSGEVMKYTDTFEAGHSYRVIINLAAKSGNEFYYDGSSVPPVKASVQTDLNTYTAKVAKAYERDPFQEINVIYDAGVCEYQKVSAVGIIDVAAPVQGKAPDYSADKVGEGFAFKSSSESNPFVVNGLSWYDETGNYDLTKNGKFEAGHSYTLRAYLIPEAGYQFASTVSGTVNGSSARVSGNASAVTLEYSYPALSFQQVDAITIEGLSAPALGQSPSYVAILRGQGYELKDRNDAYYKNGICWSYMEGSDLPVSGGTKFEGGKKYQVMFSLVAQEGYEFPTNASGGLTLKATVNGKAAEIMGNKKEVIVTYYFTESTANAGISSVAVSGIDAPVIGAAPDYSAEINDTRYALLKNSSAREKNGITWINNKTGNAMSVDSAKFEAGISYSVVVSLAAANGYAFPTDASGSPKVTGSINGSAAEVSGQNDAVVYLKYTFAALQANTIPSVSITGFDTSAADPTKTDKSKLSVSDANVEIQSLTWLSSNTTNGKSYSATLSLKTKNGYKFAANATAKVNNSAAEIISLKDTEMIVKWTFAKNTTTVPSISFSDVATGAYYYIPVQWAVSGGITNGMTATTFGPDITCSQAHILTFLWRAVGKPAPTIANPYSNAAVTAGQYYYDAFLWAWEKGLIGNTAHDPNAPCSRSDVVTYLWKLEGKPQTGSAAFTVVPASADYAQAVAWAVDSNITNGMSATTFGPDVICTRGHIVTFLWRYMNN